MSADAPKQPARSALAAIINVLELFSSAALMVMMLLTFVDVLGRYVFSAPVFGASEMVSVLLALVIFSGLGIANARDRHIVVELFDSRVRELAPRAYDVLIQGFSIFAMGLIAFVLFEIAIETHEQNTRTFVLEWPLAWITGTIAVLACVSVICQILGLMTGANKRQVKSLEDE